MEHRAGPWPQTTAAPIAFAEAAAMVAGQSAAALAGLQAEASDCACALSDALGRVLARALLADRDQPPFARVTRDGFALLAADLAAGARLRVAGELRAGEAWPPARPPLQTGQAIEIMTGAALPPGADAVLMVEHAEDIRGGSIRTLLPRAGRTLRAGENVVPRGSEARQGDVLLEPGTRLRPEQIALAASCGLRSVAVYPQPKVAILATGDELLEPEDVAAETIIAPHRIYDSNSHALAALVRQAHADPLRLRAAKDRREDLSASVREGLNAAPLLLLTGGVSMGRYDLVEEVLAGLGGEFFFTGVKMQPGKPVVFGSVPARDDQPARYFFGLPGNPVSTMVTFRAFVRPLLAALSGERRWQPAFALAALASETSVKPGLTRFLPAWLDTNQPEPTVTPVANKGSGDVAANARANCYLMVPDDCEYLSAGQTVRVLLH